MLCQLQGKTVILQVDECRLSEIMYYWKLYNKPCDILIRRSKKSSNLIGVCMKVENSDTEAFISKSIETTGAKLHLK